MYGFKILIIDYTMDKIKHLAKEHSNVTRRYFLQLGTAGVTALSISKLWAHEYEGQIDPLLAEAVSKLEYLTQDKDFRNFGRGKPPPQRREEMTGRASQTA